MLIILRAKLVDPLLDPLDSLEEFCVDDEAVVLELDAVVVDVGEEDTTGPALTVPVLAVVVDVVDTTGSVTVDVVAAVVVVVTGSKTAVVAVLVGSNNGAL